MRPAGQSLWQAHYARFIHRHTASGRLYMVLPTAGVASSLLLRTPADGECLAPACPIFVFSLFLSFWLAPTTYKGRIRDRPGRRDGVELDRAEFSLGASLHAAAACLTGWPQTAPASFCPISGTPPSPGPGCCQPGPRPRWI